jgi:hypothetical protein
MCKAFMVLLVLTFPLYQDRDFHIGYYTDVVRISMTWFLVVRVLLVLSSRYYGVSALLFHERFLSA